MQRLMPYLTRKSTSCVKHFIFNNRLFSTNPASSSTKQDGVILFTMPRLSPTMKSAVLKKWKVAVGDKIGSHELICEVTTDTLRGEGQDKESHMEIEVVEGELYVAKRFVDEGSSIYVDAPMALLCEDQHDVQSLSAMDVKTVIAKGYRSALWQAYVKSADDPGAAQECS